ncbi:YktB family protein [Oceanobacillus picturae]|uniref:YktB family protein n=1 Tax=Oceanobacillus picturae TaxID=171693 RepID=UPI003642B512
MSFQGFTSEDFNTFNIEGLEKRMAAIQDRIQPKFQEVGSLLTDYLAAEIQNEMFLHIAKHARRTVNPPHDTWLAIADNKRGYKKHPHFQIGLFDDNLFIWLALIYELDHKQQIAQAFTDHYEELKALPDDFVVSLDHMKKQSIPLQALEIKDVHRFRDVKKAEFLIGRHLSPTDSRVTNGDAFINTAKETFKSLLPFYQLALKQG